MKITKKQTIGRKPALCDGLVGHHSGAGAQLADDVRASRQLGKRIDRMAQDRALPHHIHRPQQRHRAAVHAQAQVLEVSDNQSDADHRHVLVRGLLRTAHHRQPALLGPLRRPVHRAPQGVVHRSGNVLERDSGIFHVGGQYGHQAHVPVDTRRTADGGAQTAEHAGQNGLSEVPDQSPLSS